MALKLLLNTLYTIGIFLCVLVVYWAFPLQKYLFVMGAVFIAGLFVILKIKLHKEIRQRKP